MAICKMQADSQMAMARKLTTMEESDRILISTVKELTNEVVELRKENMELKTQLLHGKSHGKRGVKRKLSFVQTPTSQVSPPSDTTTTTSTSVIIPSLPSSSSSSLRDNLNPIDPDAGNLLVVRKAGDVVEKSSGDHQLIIDMGSSPITSWTKTKITLSGISKMDDCHHVWRQFKGDDTNPDPVVL